MSNDDEGEEKEKETGSQTANAGTDRPTIRKCRVTVTNLNLKMSHGSRSA